MGSHHQGTIALRPCTFPAVYPVQFRRSSEVGDLICSAPKSNNQTAFFRTTRASPHHNPSSNSKWPLGRCRRRLPGGGGNLCSQPGERGPLRALASEARSPVTRNTEVPRDAQLRARKTHTDASVRVPAQDRSRLEAVARERRSLEQQRLVKRLQAQEGAQQPLPPPGP